jgi:aminopeptidase N
MIVLSEKYLITTTEALRLSLIAHEITHMWIGNMATIYKWTELCLQVNKYVTQMCQLIREH